MTNFREDAVKIVRGVGGKTFPNDYNWICPNGHESRAFETACYTCQVDERHQQESAAKAFTDTLRAPGGPWA